MYNYFHVLSRKSLLKGITGKEKLPLVIFPQRIPSLREVSNYTITEAMRRANGNQTIAAKFLGISQQALSKRLKLNNN